MTAPYSRAVVGVSQSPRTHLQVGKGATKLIRGGDATPDDNQFHGFVPLPAKPIVRWALSAGKDNVGR
jgi:hypothetical protein